MNWEIVVGLLAAVLAAGAAVGVAVTSNKLERWKVDRQASLDRETRAGNAAGVLARYQRPLRATADELRGRLDNLLNDGFGDYFDQPEYSQLALRSTLYRLSSYFGVVQLIERDTADLETPGEDNKSRISDDLAEVGKAFARDSQSSGQSLMIWREQQRAIGGLMLNSSKGRGINGFEVFDESYTAIFERWFKPAFIRDLTSPTDAARERMTTVEGSLQRLIKHLDEDLGHRQLELH